MLYLMRGASGVILKNNCKAWKERVFSFRDMAFLISVFVLSSCEAPKNDNSKSETPVELSSRNSTKSETALSTMDRTELAIFDQISCKKPPEAAIAIRAMIRNGIIKDSGAGADGSPYYVPMKPLKMLGFSIVRITGWQADKDFIPMKPFGRGPGTLPPNFFAISVAGDIGEVRDKLRQANLDKSVSVEDGDMGIESPVSPGATLTCYAALVGDEQ